MQQTRISGGILLAATLIAGCSATTPFKRDRLAMPVGPSFVGGRGVQLYPTSTTVIANVKDAMSDVGMHSIHEIVEPNGTKALEATTADNRSARVTVQTTGVRTMVAAKVGWFGDEPLTRAFLDRLGTRQGTLPPDSTPVDISSDTPEMKVESGSNPIISRSAVPDAVMLRERMESGSPSLPSGYP